MWLRTEKPRRPSILRGYRHVGGGTLNQDQLTGSHQGDKQSVLCADIAAGLSRVNAVRWRPTPKQVSLAP